MDSAKQEPEEISEITDSNLLELYGSDVIYQEQEESTENDPVKPCVKRNRYVCRKCGREFADRMALMGHEKRWSKLFCEICDEEFQCKFGLVQHIRRDHENEFGCRKCPYVGKNLEAFRAHSKRMHTAQSVALQTSLEMSDTHKYACSKCGLEFGTRKGFRGHQSQMGNFKCLLCNEEFECEYARSQHLGRDHEKEISQLAALQKKESSKLETFDVEMKFQCDYCGLSFDKKYKLIYHMSVHVKFVTSCEECGFRSRDLTWHRKKYSGNFKCSRKNCNKVFKCKRALNIHIGKDHDETWKCPECPKTFKAMKQFRNHRDKQHNKNFQCELCELSFLKERILLHHKWEFHEKDFAFVSVDSTESIVPKQEESSTGNDPVKQCVKRFACRLACRKCGLKFTDRMNLKRHEKHWSKRLCEICDKEFQCKFGLGQHIRQDHENESKCRKCPFVGKDLKSLRIHCIYHHKAQSIALQTSLEMSETHDKYACNICGLEFGTRKGFREHQLQMGNFKCLFCDEEFECEYASSQHLERDHEQEFNQLALHQKEQSELDFKIQFECDHCGLSFDNRPKLLYHMCVHVKFVTSCEECGFRSRDLTWHRKNYSGNFKCSRKNCNKVFKCKLALKIHARDEHEQNWKCPECPKVLKTRKSFKSHFTIYHRKLRGIAEPLRISKDPRPGPVADCFWQCNQCQISFAGKALLKFHMLKHEQQDAAMEALVFSCKNCGADFESQNELSLHQTIADEYNCAFWDEKYDFKQEKSSYIDQRLETVVKNEQDSPSMTDTLCMNIHLKEEPDVSYVLKLPSE